MISSPILAQDRILSLNENTQFNRSLSPDSKQDKIKLCLTMIVKNEGKIIERCLESSKEYIDCISICDTGSTDNTIQLIENFMKTNNIPGKVHKYAWKNFGHNRTLSIQAAQKTLEDLGFSLQKTYLLLLDADMLLTSSAFDKQSLTDDQYNLMQKSTSMSYYNTRLVRASMPWECIGVTHEYWGCKQPHSQGKLTTLVIDDREDGGCKADKFERDIKLLTQGLIDEPNNERYLFYLAQSHKCLNHYDEAIKIYKERIVKGGWPEEIWFSKCMLGECYEANGDWDQALHWFQEAYEYNPVRAEPLHNIAKHYRHKGQNNLACLYAQHGACIPYPEEQILFITHPVYDYQFDEEISIAGYYTPFKEKGFVAANKLLLNKAVPTYVKEQTHKNIYFYVENLKNTQYIPIQINLPPLREGSIQTYRPMNPSIQKTKDGYTMIVRTINFQQKDGHYDLIEPEEPKVIRTKNFLVHLDRDFKILSQQEIIEDLPRQQFKSWAEGVDDCRLFEWNKSNWYTCTSYDINAQNTPTICLCKLADKASGDKIQVEKFVSLKGPDPKRCEKNWMPFIKDNQLNIIYSYDPFIVYIPDVETGECKTIISNTPTSDFSRFRGSAAPIAFDDGYLMLVHEVVFADNKRYYLHRFLYLDKDLNIKRLSKPFTFKHKGIEYTCGMTLNHEGKKLIIGLGIEDREAYLGMVDLETVKTMLEPIP